MTNNYYHKNKENLQNEARKRYQHISEEKLKYVNMLMNDTEIFPKKKKKRSISNIVNVIRIFLRNKSKRKLSI